MIRAIACGMLTTASVHGAVVFTDIVDIPFFSAGTHLTRAIDLNGDGVDDAVFRNFGNEFAVYSTLSSSIAGIPTIPPNQNHFAAPLGSGSIIGNSLESSFHWNEGYSGLISVVLIGMETYKSGLWGSMEAYVGVQFDIEGQSHFGWILVDTPFDTGGGIIKAFAYESEPGVPIVAGVVPESSSSLFIGVSCGIALARRRRS